MIHDNRQCSFKYHDTLLRMDWYVVSGVSIDCSIFFIFNDRLSKHEVRPLEILVNIY